MPKAGARLPWRLTFQYGTQAQASRQPHYTREDAMESAEEMLATAKARGTSVALAIENRDTGEHYAYPRTKGESEVMADEINRSDVNTDEGKAVIEQIDANIERGRSLTAADALPSLNELKAETETLISSLSGKGVAAIKASKRAALLDAERFALKAIEAANSAPSTEVATPDFMDIEGMAELISDGAEKVAEGIRLHIEAETTARDIARIALDMWRRIPNKDGNPDIAGDSAEAKKASSALKQSAGKALREAYSQDQGYDIEEGLRKLWRSVQTQRIDVRAQYLRGLDDDSEEAEAERQRYAKILKGRKEGDAPVSKWVAQYYGVSLKGPNELGRERYRRRQEALAKGEKPQPEPDDKPALPPVELAQLTVKSVKRDLSKFTPEDVKKLSPKEREELKPEIEAMFTAAKALMAEFI